MDPNQTAQPIGVDRDPQRRPGVPRVRPPAPWPHSRSPITRQPGTPAAPLHGRPNKTMPPVFGTAIPPHGVSGALRKLAYQSPDHKPSHWLLLMFADRVDAWSHRAKKLAPFALPAVAAFAGARRLAKR